MAITVTNVCDEARLLLNDVGVALFTDTVLLPAVKKSYRELQQKVGNNGGHVMKEQSANLTIPTPTTTISFSTSPALPSTLLYPIQLEEKMVSEADSRFIPMTETEWVPTAIPATRLRYWTWIDDEIRFVGATTDVPIRIRYYGGLAELTGGSSNILILDSLTFLAARTAAIAATTLGGSPQKGQIIQADADDALNTLLERTVKNLQGIGFRRRKFRAFRRRPFWRA